MSLVRRIIIRALLKQFYIYRGGERDLSYHTIIP